MKLTREGWEKIISARKQFLLKTLLQSRKQLDAGGFVVDEVARKDL